MAETWQGERQEAMDRTIAELAEVGSRQVVPHGAAVRMWREDRDAAICRARTLWTSEELSDARIAQLVGLNSRERVRQITDGTR